VTETTYQQEVSRSCQDTAILPPRSLSIKFRKSLTANEYGVIGRDNQEKPKVRKLSGFCHVLGTDRLARSRAAVYLQPAQNLSPLGECR
jgi:hypothetical protein